MNYLLSCFYLNNYYHISCDAVNFNSESSNVEISENIIVTLKAENPLRLRRNRSFDCEVFNYTTTYLLLRIRERERERI